MKIHGLCQRGGASFQKYAKEKLAGRLALQDADLTMPGALDRGCCWFSSFASSFYSVDMRVCPMSPRTYKSSQMKLY